MEFDRICSWNSISIFIIIQLKCGHSGCSETGLLLGWIFLDGNCQMELDWICSGNSGNYCNLHTVFQILHHSCSNPSKLNYYLATEDASGRELGMVMLASQMGLYRSIWVFSELRHSQYKVGDQVAMAFWMCFHCWLFAWLILFWLWITRPNQFFWGSVTKPVFLGQCYQTRFLGQCSTGCKLHILGVRQRHRVGPWESPAWLMLKSLQGSFVGHTPKYRTMQQGCHM